MRGPAPLDAPESCSGKVSGAAPDGGVAKRWGATHQVAAHGRAPAKRATPNATAAYSTARDRVAAALVITALIATGI